MKTIAATYRIITPMFIGGAEGAEAELRIPSIKGAIRFWWRALNWQKKCEKKCCDSKSKNCVCTEDLYKREVEIFGGSYTNEKEKIATKQSEVLFSFDKKPIEGDITLLNNNPQYLGYGIDNAQGIKAEKIFVLKIQFKVCVTDRKCITDRQIISVKNAMIAWGLFGGLGKRSRKGFGSVAIQSLIFKGIKQKDIDFVSDNYKKYKAHINNIIPKLEVFENTDYPPYSAFSQDSKIFITDIDNLKTDATKVHKDLEGAYKRYRSGNGQSNNKPERKDFGTPVAFKNDPNDSTSDRRASPIFLHTHPIKESNSVQYVGVRLYLPAMDIKHPGLIQKFLEDGAIEIKNI